MDAAFPAGMVEEIERFLAADHKRKSSLVASEDVFNSGLFFPLQRQRELVWMLWQASQIKPVTVMEIGADKGGGLYHWVKALPSVKNVIACEIRGTPYARAFQNAFPNHSFLWMPHCSRTPDMRLTIKDRYGMIDCLFIDGDKAMFWEDFKHYEAMIPPHGIVFMHDVQDAGPRRAFLRACCEPGWNGRVHIDVEDAIQAVRREAKGVPPVSAHEGWLRHWQGQSCGVGMLWRQR